MSTWQLVSLVVVGWAAIGWAVTYVILGLADLSDGERGR